MLLMEEILHQLVSTKPSKYWNILPITLPKTNILHLKNDGFNSSFYLYSWWLNQPI